MANYDERDAQWNAWKNNRPARNVDDGKGGLEYYEDTHEGGQYKGKAAPVQLPNAATGVAARMYQNMVMYEPKSPDDVQRLIDYLKRREPAIVNLDLEIITADSAQRILDFVSGAIYALNGSVQRVKENIFLLAPEGVEITIPYEHTDE